MADSTINLLERERISMLEVRGLSGIKLGPLDLSVASESQNWEIAEEYHVDDCIECGCCSYICPSNRPIVQQIRHAKAALRKIRSAQPAG